LTTVLLVMMFGQSRVFYAMSRDGLIPPSFTRIHPTWRTPIFSTLFFGVCIAAIAAFTPINIVGSLTNMGTLVAFMLVSIAVPILRHRHPELKGQFTLPLGPYIIPIASAVTALGLVYYLKVGNPVWFGIPIVWAWFLIWMIVGLVFYLVYGRNKSYVAIEEAERLAVVQPPVN
jgi:basic amino acid/polyamine antiporter, APA family